MKLKGGKIAIDSIDSICYIITRNKKLGTNPPYGESSLELPSFLTAHKLGGYFIFKQFIKIFCCFRRIITMRTNQASQGIRQTKSSGRLIVQCFYFFNRNSFISQSFFELFFIPSWLFAVNNNFLYFLFCN